MKFKPYMHVEKLGNEEVEGIEQGTTWIFPKVDGTNASVWLDGGELRAGSRTRQLTLENDNAGFYAAMLEDSRIIGYLSEHPNHRLYGEWLVPHTLKAYRADAWKRFWIFDVATEFEVWEPQKFDQQVEQHEMFLNYDQYSPELEKFGLDYIVPMFKLENATYEYLHGALERNQFLIDDGKSLGEGIVIKNYEYTNRYGRVCWAKIVRQEFKEHNQKVFGVASIGLGDPVEKQIVERHLTTSMIDKIYDKIVVEQGGWQSKFIPRLLETAFYDLVREEIWTVLKAFKNPTINFKSLKAYTTQKVKEVKKELF